MIKNKVAIVGCGKVGMTSAYALLHQGVVNELVLVGRDRQSLVGEQLDLEHGMPFLQPAKVSITDDYAYLSDADVIVVTAGAPQQPGESRLELAQKNMDIAEHIVSQITANAKEAVIIMVSNPVDLLTYRAYTSSKWPKGRIFGTGTVLDTNRFRFHLAEFLKVHPKSIHAYVLGEHGDNSFPVISNATIGGQLMRTFSNYSNERMLKAYDKSRKAAYRIIESKGATFYAIGTVVAEVVSAVLRDSKAVLTTSIPLHDYYGISGIALSVPCVVGRQGVERILDVQLSAIERQKLESAARELKKYI